MTCDCHAPSVFGHVPPCSLAHPQGAAFTVSSWPDWLNPWAPIPAIDGGSR